MKSATQQLDNNKDHAETTDQKSCLVASTSGGENIKRPAIKSLQLMKPSLSLTSLPPQSPKELSNDGSNERPYNSLKKKRDKNERELWRRSWESQNSVSTTTSQTGASTGKNEFWATYNYLMDSSIIDSCKEASGDVKFENDVAGDINFKPINQSNIQESPGSQGSFTADPRRLRRWLKDFENRISKLPSLKEAMKLSANELTRYSVESSDFYREINSNSRLVAACVRSLEKENLSTKTVDEQPKSLDYSEHGSLVSATTAVSTESKRSENALKPNALERRYYLLYLRAFELQCMFEGLLEKRNFQQLNGEFQKNKTDTSDEEPIAKIPKFNTKFYSHVYDAEFEDTGAGKEMECVALNGVDQSNVVSVNESSSPLKSQSPLAKENLSTTVKRPKDFSKFNQSNRKSKNCAIFYYRHIDTDNDQIQVNGSNNSEPMASSSSEEEVWEYTNPVLEDNIGKEIITTDNENLSHIKNNVNEKSNVHPQQISRQITINASNKKELITKESWRELALEAESIVLQKINDKATKTTDYVFNEIVETTKHQQTKKMTEKGQKESVKYTRVQEWLTRNNVADEDPPNIHAMQIEEDGDASAECTSDSEQSISSEEITDSVATTCLQGTDPIVASTENTSSTLKVVESTLVMRSKTNHRRNSERPWSVSCLSQLTRNSRQSLDDKVLVSTTAELSNFSISESAINHLPNHKNTSESGCNYSGSKNSSLRRRRVKLRKKSLSSKPDAFHTSLMEDLSLAISMMNVGKEGDLPKEVASTQKSDEEQSIKRPNFKIGSITSVYGNPNAINLGSLAALSNYNSAEKYRENNNDTGTENLSGFSEKAMWDNYMGEKYNSEAYSEDRDVDAARNLLDCDDYRNFIDSQSDCCSSLNSAANQQLNSFSPPRPLKNIESTSVPQQSSSNDNSLRQRRSHEDRKILLESLLKKANELGVNANKPTENLKDIDSKRNNHISDIDDYKFIEDCKLALEQTQALASANPQLFRSEDYDEIARTCLKNIERLKSIKGYGCENASMIEDLIDSWNALITWSENTAKARRLQEEIILQKQLLDLIDIDNALVLNSEEAIREKINELMSSREELFKHRSNMLKLNAAVHSWLTRHELDISRNHGSELSSQNLEQKTFDFVDVEFHKHLKDEIISLYSKWDSINANLTTKLEGLRDSLICWTKFERELEDLKENLLKDRGALNGLRGAIEEGTKTTEELVDNVQQVSKLLSEKLENRIHTFSSNEDFMKHPEATLKFIASSNGSYQSDSGISDGGFSELSERERRLIALKKIAKQLESALSLSASSDVLKTITQRMEAAENELKVLQTTCRELILRTSTELLKQQGIDISTHAQSQINVQIPIITIKNKTKRTLPRRGKKRASPISNRQPADQRVEHKSNHEGEGSELEATKKLKWIFFKRVTKFAVSFTIITLFCIACLFEPRCCDTLNNLSMSLTPSLRYIKGPPPT